MTTTPAPAPAVSLVTSIYGGYDEPCVPVVQDPPCDYQMVTDMDLGRFTTLHPWRLRAPDGLGEIAARDPRHAARYAKFTPGHVLDPVPDVAVWIDGRVVVTSPRFVAWALDQLGDADIAVWRHEFRSTTQAEANAAAGEMPRKYLAADLAGHRSMHEGQTDDQLWRLTVMVTRINSRTHAAGVQVLDAMHEFPRSIDQIEFPYACRDHGVEVTELPGTIWDHGGMLHLRPHRDGT